MPKPLRYLVAAALLCAAAVFAATLDDVPLATPVRDGPDYLGLQYLETLPTYSAVSNFVDALGYAGAISNEAALRLAGDAANSNHVAAVRTELLATNAAVADRITGIATNYLPAAALAATALQPPATNTLADAAAHAATAHSVTDDGGFAGGTEAMATTGGAIGMEAMATTGGAIGMEASAITGGAVGTYARAEGGGAVGTYALTTTGGAVGADAFANGAGGAVGAGAFANGGGFAGGDGASTSSGGAVGAGAVTITGGAVGVGAAANGGGGAVGASTQTTTGGAVGEGAVAGAGFAGGYGARAEDGVTLIDAIQLGMGVNPDAGTLQVYSHKLLDSGGNIPVERIPVSITNGLLSQAEAAATYLPTANIPGPGCTDISASGVISGATYNYLVSSTTNWTLSVSASAPRYNYHVRVLSTNNVVFSDMVFFGSYDQGYTNSIVVGPYTGDDWQAQGGTVQ